jgi:hypothetical protein
MDVEVVMGTPFAPSMTEGIGVSQGGYCCVGAAIPIVDNAGEAPRRRVLFFYLLSELKISSVESVGSTNIQPLISQTFST